MKAHIACAQHYWKNWVRPGDTLIDATVGNGHDTVYLATLLKGKGQLIGYDIQPEALEKAKERLSQLTENERNTIVLKCQSHALFDESHARLITYNLGYLPGGNKAITTRVETTLQSLDRALDLVFHEGAISIMCYPGHDEGHREQEAILTYLKTLPPSQWNICYHQWINRTLSPALIWLQRVPHA